MALHTCPGRHWDTPASPLQVPDVLSSCGRPLHPGLSDLQVLAALASGNASICLHSVRPQAQVSSPSCLREASWAPSHGARLTRRPPFRSHGPALPDL